MNKIFRYSLLKYRPSYALNEQVNVGILFIFADDDKAQFSFPRSLSRLSALYPDIDLPDTKRYLSYFQTKANQLSNKNRLIEGISENFIEEEFLIADANSFFFSDFKFGIYDSIEKTVTHFTNQYFAPYNDPSVFARKNDDYLVRKFTEGIKMTDKLPLFKKDVSLSNGRVKATFDYCWQNGTTNYAKALSFDFVRSESIQRKAVQWFGEVVQLGIKNNLDHKRFDFWVAEPSNQQLFKYFDKALEILDSIPQNKKIITEKDFPQYIEEAVETSKPFEVIKS